MINVTQHATKSNHHVITAKNQVAIEIDAVSSRKIKANPKTPKIVLPKLTVIKQTLILTTITTDAAEMTENRKLSTYPVRTVAKPTTPQNISFLEPMQHTNHFSGILIEQDQYQRQDKQNIANDSF